MPIDLILVGLFALFCAAGLGSVYGYIAGWNARGRKDKNGT